MDSALLVAPVNLKDFIETYWESQPLLVSRKDTGHFSDLLSVAGIRKYISDNTVSFPAVQAVSSKASISASDYTNDSRHVNAEQLFLQYEQGATIIVAEVHRKFAAVSEFCKLVNKGLQVRCQANAYLSPPGNQGFHSHYDTHDVFVLQVSGRKTFRFYPSDIELPFTDDTFHPDNHTHSQVSEEVELSAGDTLYIPRGMVHDAIADDGEPSLHITLGVFPFVVRDLLQEMVQVAAEQDVNLRRSVNLNVSTDHAALLHQLPTGIFNEDICAEAISRLADEVAVDCNYELDSADELDISDDAMSMVDSTERFNLRPDVVVSVNPAAIHSTEYRYGLFKLRLPGQVIRFSEPLSVAVATLLEQGSIKVESLPGLNSEQQLALCRQLIEAGAIGVDTDL